MAGKRRERAICAAFAKPNAAKPGPMQRYRTVTRKWSVPGLWRDGMPQIGHSRACAPGRAARLGWAALPALAVLALSPATAMADDDSAPTPPAPETWAFHAQVTSVGQ